MPSKNLIMTRTNPIAEQRFPQLRLNALASQGGRRYIDARLWRAPNESSLSWDGTLNGGNMASIVASMGGSIIRTSGRKDRTACVSDAARIVSKINGYLFAEDASRQGVNEAWALNVDGAQTDIRSFWEAVSTSLTHGQWLWLQADRGASTEGPVSVLDRSSDVPKWTLWPATSVPDWHFNADGKLMWLITAGETVSRDDPTVEARVEETRTIWRAGVNGSTASFVQYRAPRTPEDDCVVASGTLSVSDIPFVLVGQPSLTDYWYDTVENLQALLLNMTSLHSENLIRTVYPQLVIAESMLQGIETRLIERSGSIDGRPAMEVVREIVRGLDSPFVESAADKGTTRFLQPSASDLAAMPQEIERVRKALYESIGLALTQESRMVASAESKAFDHLDIDTTIKNRALTLQAAEEKLVAVTKGIDSRWADYTPAWPTEFGIEREDDKPDEIVVDTPTEV